MRRSARGRGIASVLFVLLALIFLAFGNTQVFATAAHIDAAPHTAPEGLPTSDEAGCHLAGACHQIAIPVHLREIPFRTLASMASRPAAMGIPAEALPEFDTPPPRA